MEKYMDLLIAVSKLAFTDLIDAYRKHDNLMIAECERYFTGGKSLFGYLNIDGNIIVKQARKESGYDKE